jgi:tRNA G46 methylase TrmB
MTAEYVHGYTDRESVRLEDQANCLSELLHHDSLFAKDSLILEAGCGVGSQTKIIAPKNPGSKFISIDISEDSLKKAEKLTASLHIDNKESDTIYKFPRHAIMSKKRCNTASAFFPRTTWS